MAAVEDDLRSYAQQLNSLATAFGTPPADRITALRRLRDEIADAPQEDGADPAEVTSLLGQADTYIGQCQLEQEAWAIDATMREIGLREDADVRDMLVASGDATPRELDDIGAVTHDELDADTDDGTLTEALLGRGGKKLQGMALSAYNALHPRSRTGQWEDKPGMPKPLAQRPNAPEVPNVPNVPNAPQPPASPGAPDVYEQRRQALQQRVQDAAASGIERAAQPPAPQSPGTEAPPRPKKPDTSPTPDAFAKRQFGHASQKELLAYAAQAASQPTTVDAYSVRDPKTGRRVYDESRKALHEKIISKFLDPVPAQPPGQAKVFFTGGGYASGKGGVVDSHPDLPPDALVIDPDKIKGELPEFQQLLESDPEANLLTYEEAWDISQELQRRAIAKNVNTVVDGISDTSPKDMLDRVKLYTDAGYKDPKVVYVTIPTDEAITRAEKRAREAKKASDRRFIPEVIMRSVHRDVSATMPGIVRGSKKLGLSVEVWDNNQGKASDGSFNPPKKIFESDPAAKGGPKVLDQALWDGFLGKAKEKIPGVDDKPLREKVSDKTAQAAAAGTVALGPVMRSLEKRGLHMPLVRSLLKYAKHSHSHHHPGHLDGEDVLNHVSHFQELGHHAYEIALGILNHGGHEHAASAAHAAVPHAPAIAHALSLLAAADIPDDDIELANRIEEALTVDDVERDLQESEFDPDHPQEGEGYIDLPYESGSADPQPLEYADLGPSKKYTPGEDFRAAQARADGGESSNDQEGTA